MDTKFSMMRETVFLLLAGIVKTLVYNHAYVKNSKNGYLIQHGEAAIERELGLLAF